MMKLNVPLPGKLEFKDWAEKFIANYPNSGISLPRENQDWSEWGQLLMSVPEFKTIPNPLKSMYKDDWQSWAILMISTKRDS
jgi:hypothetical protein